jgi:Zn-dependent membrane protease YugP
MTKGRAAQNVSICVACIASHDVGKAAQNESSR